jgi:hypothetical protein
MMSTVKRSSRSRTTTAIAYGGIGHLCERFTAPQPQRLSQPACRVLDLAVPQRVPTLTHQTLEPQDVDGLRRQVEAVAAGRRAHRRLFRQGPGDGTCREASAGSDVGPCRWLTGRSMASEQPASNHEPVMPTSDLALAP